MRIAGLEQRSAILIIVLVFGLLFALLYMSTFVAGQNSNSLNTILETKKAEASLSRLINPEPVCFTLENDSLGKYSFLSDLIKEADVEADLAPPTHFTSNRYDGFATGVNATDILHLIRQYQDNFNHTTATINIRNYTDDTHTYDCNFTYKGNQYYINVKFQSLTVINNHDGFVPIYITSTNKGMVNHLTYYTFNNTAVWTNNLNSFVTLTLETKIERQNFTVTTQIPPGKSWDYRLWPDLTSENNTVYHYEVQDNESSRPIANSNIIVKYYPKCMDQKIAKSLYSQSGVDMKFSAYLPEGYQYICGIHFYNNVIIQAYWNKTVEDPLELEYGENKVLDFPNYAFHPEALDNGVIQIIAGKSGVFTSYTDAQERYDDIKNETNYLDQRLIEIDNVYDGNDYQAVGYRHNVNIEKDIYILEAYDKDNQEFYLLKGKVPLAELVRMAESLKS
jgi:hypothetical protein